MALGDSSGKSLEGGGEVVANGFVYLLYSHLVGMSKT